MKIDLGLDFEAITNRIEKEKRDIRPGKWAKSLGVSANIVSNIHGKTRQKPSLEYIVAVSMATGRPIEYFLFGVTEFSGMHQMRNWRSDDLSIIGCFQQKELALELNRNALQLEQLNPKALKEVVDFIQFKLDCQNRQNQSDG